MTGGVSNGNKDTADSKRHLTSPRSLVEALLPLARTGMAQPKLRRGTKVRDQKLGAEGVCTANLS